MVVPPSHSDNPPTTPTASEQHESDLTLNAATPGADVDAAPDLRLSPEVEPSAAEPSHVDIYVKDEADRSWLARLRSLKASWEKERIRPRAPDEPVPVSVPLGGASNLEKHLASLAALREVCANIDQRLARVEHVSEQQDVAAIDEALRDLCMQTYERLARIEAAVQRTEEVAAQRTLHDVCQNIDARLERTEETLHSSERVVAEWLEGHSGTMTARFAGLEQALQRTENAVMNSEGSAAERHQELSGNMTARFAAVEQTLQRTENAVMSSEGSAAERLQELSGSMTARFAAVEQTLQRTENAVMHSEGSAAERLQELSGNMTARFAEVEETLRLTPKSVADRMLPNIERQLMQARMALQRTEEAVTDKTLHELCQSINARLERTEDRLHRNEDNVAAWLQEFSARISAKFAEADEAVQRIERSLSSRVVEQHFYHQPTEQVDTRAVQAEETAQPLNGKQRYRPIQLPWMAGLVVPVLVLVATLAIASLIKTGRTAAPDTAAPKAAAAETAAAETAAAAKRGPVPTIDQISTPVAPATKEEIRAPSTPAVMANAPRTTRESTVFVPPQRATRRESAPTSTPTSTPSPRFVGTLSITSVPSGASVSINGKPAGKTPLRLARQRAGSLAVQVAHDGFERWSAAVLVPADQLTQVNAKLRATAR
jgi:hypothetical protein